MYTRKTRDRWDIETNYGDGWFVECSEYTRKDAKEQYNCYVKNLQDYGKCLVRMTKRRERMEQE